MAGWTESLISRPHEEESAFLIRCVCVCLCVRIRGEAVQVLMGRLWMAVREKRRVDEALPQTYRRQAFQVQSLRQVSQNTCVTPTNASWYVTFFKLHITNDYTSYYNITLHNMKCDMTSNSDNAILHILYFFILNLFHCCIIIIHAIWVRHVHVILLISKMYTARQFNGDQHLK